jgi:hypothetical protein
MKRLLLVLAIAGCASKRISHHRSGWGSSCQAADPNLIQCGGKLVAKVECFQPSDESCGALAVNYTDGERVFLWRPAGFEPGQEASLPTGGAIRPELGSDGRLIWFKGAQSGREIWTVYEPETGILREVDESGIFRIREHDPHSMPLWAVTAK